MFSENVTSAVQDLLTAVRAEVERLNPVSVDAEHLRWLKEENEVLKRRNRGVLDENKRVSVENEKLKIRLDKVKQERRDRWEGVISALSKRARHAERQVSELNEQLDRQAAIITEAQQQSSHLKDTLYGGPEEDYDLDEAPF